MFRLIKSISGGNINENVVDLGVKTVGTLIPGSAITCNNNTISSTDADVAPDYIVKSITQRGSKICYAVTNDMIFKVEYVSAMQPKLGMKVGLANKVGVSDAVTYNSSGKGLIVHIINKNMVYVRFQKS